MPCCNTVHMFSKYYGGVFIGDGAVIRVFKVLKNHPNAVKRISGSAGIWGHASSESMLVPQIIKVPL